MKTPTGKIYYIQCSTWRDKKQVTFLHTTTVGNSRGKSVKRHTKGRRGRGRIEIAAPQSQQTYVENFNAVDRNDRDSADWSTTIQTVRYFLRIFTWMLDRVLQIVYQIVVDVAKVLKPEWKRYTSKNNGRHDFQIDLGISLLNYAIKYDLDNKDKLGYTGDYPNWMKQGVLDPCRCEKCYFCIKGLTNGIVHKHTGKRSSEGNGDSATTKKSKAVVECTDDRVGLTLADGSPMKWNDYCKKCLEKRSGKWKDKVKKCPTSKLGCAKCNEPICRECWKTYDHPKAQKSS